MNIEGYPKSNQVLVKNNNTKKQQIACFKNGQLGIHIYSSAGKHLNSVYEPHSFISNYTILKMDKKPRKMKEENYHDKSVIHNGEFKCLIKQGNYYFVNWGREEKGKPMTYKSFKANDQFQSINDFFIRLYEDLNNGDEE